ncbi:MAG: molybdopterin-dependent oxidoreductase [Coriobacteriia bacterium]|nr:molybdopterin-dependent oxidoreductase [Coriobacteriia bacterium]
MGNLNLPVSWQEDGYTVTRTTHWSAPGCHAGCGILCYVNNENGVLEKVEGDKENPFNQGRLCPRCVVLPDIVNSPDRLLYPMKRDPSQRGNPDAWERVTWDEALDLIYDEMTRLSNEYGAHTLQTFCGTGRDILWQVQRLAYAMGTPHVESYSSGLACWMPRLVSYNVSTGAYMMPDCSEMHEDRYDNPEFKIPEVMVVWGCNPVASNSDGFFGDWIVEVLRRGTKLIVIDPRLTWMAARADIWIQPRPAVDSAIAMAMLKVIIEEDLYDHEFVDLWTYGFEALVERCAEYDFDDLCEKAWVPADKVREAARVFAAGRYSSVQLGLSLDMQRNGIGAVRSIISMLTICGDIDQPGGQVFAGAPFDFHYFSWGYKELPEDVQKMVVGYDEYPFIRMGMVLDQPDLAVVQAETEEPYGFTGAIMMGTNPLACMSNADLNRVYPVLQKLKFIAVADYRLTPTIQMLADVALPCAMSVEKLGMIAKRTGAFAISPIAGMTPIGEPKSDAEIVWRLGKRFNEKMFDFDSVEEIFDFLVQKSGLTWAEIRKQHWAYAGQPYQRYEKGLLREDGQPGFNTRTGRIELYSSLAEDIGDNALPYYDEPYYSPYTTPELYKEYPVITMTGTRNIYYFHSEHRDVAKLREMQPDPLVEMNDEWGKEQGFRDGDWVWVENKIGRIKHRAKLTPIVLSGMANVNSGWWFPEMDPHEDPMYGVWDVNPNLLSELGQQGPTGFGADVKALLCKIYKCEEGEF